MNAPITGVHPDLLGWCKGLGVCGACVVTLTLGRVAETKEARRWRERGHLADGEILACQSWPLGPVAVLRTPRTQK